MKHSVIIVTGCDSGFYAFMQDTLSSLTALHLDEKASIGILDLGLTFEQVQALTARGYTVQKPQWHDPVPGISYKPYEVGYLARTELREYFSGYKTYLWFDADAWAQTTEFFDLMVDGAAAYGAAVVRENGLGYRRPWIYRRWWYGNLITAYGLPGVRIAARPAINNGILAISDTAPHWALWSSHYRTVVEKRRKMNMEQLAFNAMLELENLPCAVLPARCNWVCTLSTPAWNPDPGMICEPGRNAHPLSVIHLAGSDKLRPYRLKQTTGGHIDLSLAYRAIQPNAH